MVPILEGLCEDKGIEVVAAVTPPDRERGRGRRSEPPPVKEAALRLGVPVLQPETLRSRLAQTALTALSPDVIVVVAYGKLLPRPVLDLPSHGCLNLHPSLLPRHRGPSPVASAILEGDEVTGVSLMLLDEGTDTGPLVAQREYPLTGEEITGELTDSLFKLGAELLKENLSPWTGGHLQARPQDDAQATVSRKLERADGLANWTLAAEILARQGRAYSPWPGLYTYWEGRTLKLLEVFPLPESVGSEPVEGRAGRVISAAPPSFAAIATGKGLLGVSRIQLEGRRAVSIRELLSGYPEFMGACLG